LLFPIPKDVSEAHVNIQDWKEDREGAPAMHPTKIMLVIQQAAVPSVLTSAKSAIRCRKVQRVLA
jgi:hypothetical protein